jgi:hypothetical protein
MAMDLINLLSNVIVYGGALLAVIACFAFWWPLGVAVTLAIIAWG